MKLRTLLLASAAVMFTTSAMAVDITNPFYLPAKGKFLSDTKIQMNRGKTDNGTVEHERKVSYARKLLPYTQRRPHGQKERIELRYIRK